MKHTLLTMTLAAQIAGGAALAQTQGDTDDVNDNQSQTNAPDLQPVAYGGDWPQTLVLAMFTQDDMSVRPAEEIGQQWMTLAPEDQEFIRRDCADVLQLTETEVLSDNSGAMTGGADTGPATDPDETESALGTGANTTGTVDGEAPADVVTGAEVEGTTGQAGETGRTGETSVTPFSGETNGQDNAPAIAEEDMMMSDAAGATEVQISIAQMRDICAATQDM